MTGNTTTTDTNSPTMFPAPDAAPIPAPTAPTITPTPTLEERVATLESRLSLVVGATDKHLNDFNTRIIGIKNDLETKFASLTGRIDSLAVEVEARFTSILHTVGTYVGDTRTRLERLEAGAKGLLARLFGRKAKVTNQ